MTYLSTERDIVERESLTGGDYRQRIEELTQAKSAAAARLADLEARWAEERRLVGELRAIRDQLEAHAAGLSQAAAAGAEGQLAPAEVARLQADLARLNAALLALQGEAPLVQVCVDAQTIAEVVSGWTGIPVGKMVKDEIRTVLSLAEVLEKRVIGQSHALEAISQRIRTARARLEDPRRPIGVFLLVGPSGVGKTETALTLADTLYGGEHNMVTSICRNTRKRTRCPGSRARRPAMWAMAKAACSPRRCGASPIASCSWTRWKKPTRT